MHSEVHTVPPGRGGRCDDSTHDLANLHMLIATARARSRPLRLDVTLGDRARVQSGSGSSQFELHAALDRAVAPSGRAAQGGAAADGARGAGHGQGARLARLSARGEGAGQKVQVVADLTLCRRDATGDIEDD